tara:strand:+ start:30420 stop:31205 length:786 start_codon:yes stop_codon:yes gene_type:complete
MEIFTCQFCNKTYKRKYYYNNHIINCKLHKICKNSSKTYDTNELEINSIQFDKININEQNLFKLLVGLTSKYEKLQNDYDELKKFTNISKNKLNIIDYLNTNFSCREFDFTDFCNYISSQFNHYNLELVFKNDYVLGVSQIIIDFIEKIKLQNKYHLPLYAFNHRNGILYIYDNTNFSWTQMTEKYLNILIKEINKKLLSLFLIWKNNNENQFIDDQFSEIYVLNMKKVIGNNFDNRNKDIMIKNNIYKHIKNPIKNLFEI